MPLLNSTDISPALAVLKAQPLFKDLPGPLLSALLADMRETSFEAGALIVHTGHPTSDLFLIVDGQAERTIASPKRQVRLGPGDIVGQEAAGLTIGQADVKAISKVRGWSIPARAVVTLCERVPSLAALITHSLSGPEVTHEAAEQGEKTSSPGSSPSNKALLGWVATILMPPILFMLGLHANLSLQASLFVAIVGLVITMWIFSVVDDFIPPLIAVICLFFVELVPSTVVFSSFASPSFLTLLSVFALAAMLMESGLSTRMLIWLLIRLPDGIIWRQVAFLLYGLTLSISVSQVNRIKLLMPAFRDMCLGLKLKPGSVSVTAIFAATYAGAMLYSTAFATGKAVTIATIDLLPAHQQMQFLGLFWVGAAALATVLLTLIHLLSIRIQFRDDESVMIDRLQLTDRLKLLGPLSLVEKTTALAFVVFVLGSLTTSLHQVSPGAVAGAVLIIMLLTGVINRVRFQSSIDWSTIIFLISTDCLLRVMDYLGLGSQLSAVLSTVSVLVQGDVLRFLVLSLAVVILSRLLLPIPPGMLISAVILLPIAQTEGISLWICIFSIAIFSDIWFFPYQNSIYTIGLYAQGPYQLNEQLFMRHNQVMNFARIGVVFASLPLWKWMGLA